jgi:hypothetical protein
MFTIKVHREKDQSVFDRMLKPFVIHDLEWELTVSPERKADPQFIEYLEYQVRVELALRGWAMISEVKFSEPPSTSWRSPFPSYRFVAKAQVIRTTDPVQGKAPIDVTI